MSRHNERLWKAIKETGYSQKEIGRRCNISPGRMSKIVNGIIYPNHMERSRLCHETCKDQSYLFPEIKE